MSDPAPPASLPSDKEPPALALLTLPDGSQETVELEPLPPLPASPFKRNRSSSRKQSENKKQSDSKKQSVSKRARTESPLPSPRLTADSVASMVAAALPPRFMQFVSDMMAQPNPIAQTGKGEARQADGRSTAPSATTPLASTSTEVVAPEGGDVELGTSSLSGWGGVRPETSIRPPRFYPLSIPLLLQGPEIG